MGVEFELKYRASEKIQKTVIERSQGPWLMITMETTYYDTPDGALEKLHYTLRRRLENGVSVCTVKTPMPGIGRGEWELQCNSITEAIPELCKLGAPDNLLTLTAQGVQPVFFSMLFPQLIPPCLLCEPAAQPSGWAVTL